MDIVVCIPKDRLTDVQQEEAIVAKALAAGQPIQYFWALSRRPRHLSKGDKCYFVWNGAVRAFHTVSGFGENLTCSTTGRSYSGFALILDPKVDLVDPPRPMKSFRGFQYWPLTQR